jgi:hypothetical protein
MKPGQSRITATITHREDNPREVIVHLYESRHAGICGPCGEIAVPDGATIAQVEALIVEHGYELAGGWTTQVTYSGPQIVVEVKRAPVRSGAIQVVEWSKSGR